MSGARHWEQDKDSTLYIGNLDERCTDALVWELMLQAGPVINVHLPKDRVTQTHQGYGFVEFGSEEDADYAVKIMNQIRLHGKPIRVNKASADKRGQENGGLGGGQGVGAELFVGNLDSLVDEKTLYETFSRFGPLLAAPKVARDESNLSKGYGFVSYATFESSDEAIAHMNGQFLMDREVTVQFAYKKDGKGERHGDAAERALAAQARKHGIEVNVPALPAALVMPNNTPSAPAAMSSYQSPAANGGIRPPGVPSQFSGYPAYGSYNTPNGFQQMSVPMAGNVMNGSAPNRQFSHFPLAAPPSGAGLPARPPPSMAGYGGPTNVPGTQHSYQPGPSPSGFSPPGTPSLAMPPPGQPLGFRNHPPQTGYQPPT